MKRMLWTALAAATALLPAAAMAQERGDRHGGDQPRGGVERPAGTSRFDGARSHGWRGAGQDRSNWRRPDAQRSDRGDRDRFRPRPDAPAGRDWQRPQTRPDAGRGVVTTQDQRRSWDGNREWRRDRDTRTGGRDVNRAQDWNRSRDWRPNRDWNRGRDWNRDDHRWRGDRGRWRHDWRNDRRYDWRGYRGAHRSAYRLPRYYPPHGWNYGYRRFSIGFRLNSFLFAPRYWISDPYAYRLPDVWGPYRWVRYYDDALLVDVDTGEVVDVIHGIFW
ncbi:RcnB family protein [Sphingomonas sp. RS6]